MSREMPTPSCGIRPTARGYSRTGALEDLRRLLYFVLQILEAERQKIRHPGRRVELPQSPSGNRDGSPYAELERVTQKAEGALRTELERVCRNLRETHASEALRQQKLISQYIDLAALAQLSSSVRTAVQEPLARVRGGRRIPSGKFERKR